MDPHSTLGSAPGNRDALVALTFAFEMAIGHMRGRSWQSLLAGYDIAHGGLMAIALVLVLFAPLIAAWLRSSKAPAIQD
jgi:hypothetical protein